MNESDWTSVAALFDELAELPEAERRRRLEEITGRDPKAGRELGALLAADARAENFLRQPALEEMTAILPGESADDFDDDRAAAPGQRAGAWRLVRLLGRGGMGEVWEAERADGAYEQRAALKLLKRGLDSEAILARFRAERQILARINHPAIARLYDGGIAGDGRPFYVMELVAGAPITEAAAARGLSIDARIELVRTICAAVDAAHRALVVHRDLKPSNILLSDTGEVKLLDFGIAKLLSAEGEETLTHLEERVLTPAYAAPEQILGEPITTATDVYALGVVLYELLTGALPHRRPTGSSRELAESVERETIARPSAALGASHSSRLVGDLDAIILKALQREPERRYRSPAELSADLERHLTGRPVEARPDSVGYRLRKFARRHRAGVAAAVLVVLSLLIGVGVALVQAQRARRESERAVAAAARAHREALKSDRVSEFMIELFESASPLESGSSAPPTVVDAVRAGAERIEKTLAGEPEAQADLYLGLSGVAFGQEDLERARSYTERARDLVAGVADVDPLTLADLDRHLGELALRERKLDEAEQNLRRGLARLDDPALERARPKYLRVAPSLHNGLGEVLHERGLDAEALVEIRRAAELYLERGTAGDFQASISYYNMSMVETATGRLEDAERDIAKAREISQRHLDPADGRFFFIEVQTGDVYLARGRLEEAADAYGRAIAAARAGFGPIHAFVASGLISLGDAELERGRIAAARAAMEEGLAVARAADSLRDRAQAHRHLADVALAEGRFVEAALEFAAAGAAHTEFYGPDYPATRTIAIHGAYARSRSGDESAITTIERLRDGVRTLLGPDSREAATAALRLGQALRAAGRHDQAVAPLRDAKRIADPAFAASSTEPALIDVELGLALLGAGDPANTAEARQLVTQGVERLERLGRGWKPLVAEAKAALAR